MSPASTAIALLACLLAAGAAAAAEEDRIVIYGGYGDARGVVIEGRIVERHAERPARENDGRLRNLGRNARRFANDERKNHDLTLDLYGHTWPIRSDGEGYFLLAATPSPPAGWHPIQAASGRSRGEGMALVVPAANGRGLISDLDDTVVISEVLHKRHLLANTFFKNPTQRQAVPGVARLYAQVAATNPQPGATPLFYLSASPRQLHSPIAEFLAHNRFPPGILLTKRVSDDPQSDPWTDQFAYKTAKIEEIFARLPQVRFILVGDDGEKDPETYDWVRRHYPERVEAIWIRRVNPDPARRRFPAQENLADIVAAGYAATDPATRSERK